MRFISAVNLVDGVIVVRFSAALRQDAALTAIGSWICAAASPDAPPITIVEVVTLVRYPESVLLRYSGGGSSYQLSVRGLRSATGEPLDVANASQLVASTRAGGSEPTIRLFDSVWGPVGIAQQPSSRRSVDQLVAQRALATAVNQQLAQRLAASNGTAGRDARPGLGRS